MSTQRVLLLVTAVVLGLSLGPSARGDDPPHSNIPFFNDCLRCHPFSGQPDGTVTCLWCHGENALYPNYGATVVRTHSSDASGTPRFGYDLDCTACHHPHDQQQNLKFGTDYGKYIRELVDESIVVTDYTVSPPDTFSKDILSFIEFTNANQFIDGDGDYSEDICSTCHTLTNHHQNDGTAPGGQSHADGSTCTVCHAHTTGFAPSSDPAPPPHDVFDCSVCHAVDENGNLLDAVIDAPIPNDKCDACHAPGSPGSGAGGSDKKVATHYSDTYIDPTTGLLTSLACVECHNPMRDQINFRGNLNLDFIRTAVRGTPVVFESTTGPYSFAYDLADQPADMESWNYVCNTCHTQTNHHQGGGTAPGGQVHFDGQDCTSCHSHEAGFGGFEGDHPEANTDCSNCHLDRTTGEPDLVGLHGSDCAICHATGFDPDTFTFLGPLGTWDYECSACHNPFIPETGNLDVHTKGHRCVACHGQQRDTWDVRDIHYEHTRSANCVVCHGFVPDTGVVIGSGNRDNCHLCHGTRYDGSSIRELHEEMAPEGTSCIECHADGRPEIDVYPGDPIGGSEHVCDVCHSGEDPWDFRDDSEDLHKEHTKELLDCGACHLDANLQDDHNPMPPVDDARRQLLNRAGNNECSFCHRGGKDGRARRVHDKHVPDQWQWCYNCHEGDDLRPQGLVPPVTEPRESCRLCHNSKSYGDSYPFEIHRRHDDVKCYTCHQTVPPLFDWPDDWMK